MGRIVDTCKECGAKAIIRDAGFEGTKRILKVNVVTPHANTCSMYVGEVEHRKVIDTSSSPAPQHRTTTY